MISINNFKDALCSIGKVSLGTFYIQHQPTMPSADTNKGTLKLHVLAGQAFTRASNKLLHALNLASNVHTKQDANESIIASDTYASFLGILSPLAYSYLKSIGRCYCQCCTILNLTSFSNQALTRIIYFIMFHSDTEGLCFLLKMMPICQSGQTNFIQFWIIF